jgi:sec-independent protein translocase protein TatB
VFDIGFSELLVLAVVALVVLGPERLPKAARFAGLWVRRARAQWYSVKSELERDLAAEELRKSLHDTKEAMRGFEDSVRKTGADVERGFDGVRDAVRGTGAGAATHVAGDVAADVAAETDAAGAADTGDESGTHTPADTSNEAGFETGADSELGPPMTADAPSEPHPLDQADEPPPGAAPAEPATSPMPSEQRDVQR